MAETLASLPFSIREYERSAEWKNKSKKILDNKECACKICGRKRWKEYIRRPGTFKRMLRFAVHHVRYDNVPNEKEGDLLTLCNLCHTFCHDAVRYRNVSEMYSRVADIVDDYFVYEGVMK